MTVCYGTWFSLDGGNGDRAVLIDSVARLSHEDGRILSIQCIPTAVPSTNRASAFTHRGKTGPVRRFI